MEVTELQQSHYTIHGQSEIAPSLPDHVLVTAEIWERLLPTRIGTLGDFFFFFASIKSHNRFPFHTPFLLPTPTPESWFWFFPMQIQSSQAATTLSHNRRRVDFLDSPYNLIKLDLLFFILGPNCPLGSLFWNLAFHCTFPFLLVMLVLTELSLGTRNRLFSRKFNENRYSNELWSSYPSPRMNIQFSLYCRLITWNLVLELAKRQS